MATDSVKGTRWSNFPDPTKYDLKEVGKDVRAAGKALSPPESVKGAALDAVKRAGMRSGARLGGAGAAAAGALGAGYLVGRGIDDMTGVGKKLVDASGLGDVVDKAATSGDRVTLTKDAEERIEKGALDKKPVKRSASRTTVKAEPASKPESDYEGDEGYTTLNMKRGGRVHASKRADGIAQRGHTRYRGDKR
jgi:hypothetical protein